MSPAKLTDTPAFVGRTLQSAVYVALAAGNVAGSVPSSSFHPKNSQLSFVGSATET